LQVQRGQRARERGARGREVVEVVERAHVDAQRVDAGERADRVEDLAHVRGRDAREVEVDPAERALRADDRGELAHGRAVRGVDRHELERDEAQRAGGVREQDRREERAVRELDEREAPEARGAREDALQLRERRGARVPDLELDDLLEQRRGDVRDEVGEDGEAREVRVRVHERLHRVLALRERRGRVAVDGVDVELADDDERGELPEGEPGRDGARSVRRGDPELAQVRAAGAEG
jgi:hypothetical protein